MITRFLTEDEKLWIRAIIQYYTLDHFNKRVVELLEHILRVGRLSTEIPAAGYMKEYFSYVSMGKPSGVLHGSSEWLNHRRNSIITKYKDSDKLKEYYNNLKTSDKLKEYYNILKTHK